MQGYKFEIEMVRGLKHAKRPNAKQQSEQAAFILTIAILRQRASHERHERDLHKPNVRSDSLQILTVSSKALGEAEFMCVS
jgi:hypothetical protein